MTVSAPSRTTNGRPIAVAATPASAVVPDVAPTEVADASVVSAIDSVVQAPTAPVLIAPAAVGGGTGVAVGRPATSPLDWRTLVGLPGVRFAAQQITDASSGTASMAGARALRTHNNVSIALDFDSLVSWRGFRAYAQHKTRTGRNGSDEASFVQNYSNIDAADFNSFGEVFVEQKLFSDKLRVKVGRLDFNAEFAATDHSGSFLNASMGYSPAITAAPTFPLPVAAVNVFVNARDNLTLSVGIFDGSPSAPSSTANGSRFQIAQANQSWSLGSQQLAGRFGVGAWRHTGLFLAADDADDTEPHVQGTRGWYSTFDQTLWQGAAHKEGDDAKPVIAAYVQVGRALPDVQAVHEHEGAGLTFSGLFARRASDLFGLGVTHAAWAGGHETIGEIYYQLPIISHLSVVADYQSVRRQDSAFDMRSGSVFTMRTILTF